MQIRSISQSIKRFRLNNSTLVYSLLICLFVYLFIGLFSKANADGVSLRTYPSLIQIKAPKPTELNAKIFVENLSDNSLELNSQIKLFKQGAQENGDIEYLRAKDQNSNILSKIQLFDGENSVTQFILGPKQKKELKIKIALSESNSNSDYYFSVIFLSRPKSYQSNLYSSNSNQNSYSTITSAVASNVLLSVGADSEPSVSIEEFSSPLFLQKGPLPFNIKVHNNGSKYLSPKGTIYIKNMFGQQVGKIDLPASNILSNSSRYLGTPSAGAGSLGPKPQILWNENLLFGFYEAKLSMQASNTTPAISRTIHFSAFPLKYLSLTIIILILIMMIAKRVKDKMSR